MDNETRKAIIMDNYLNPTNKDDHNVENYIKVNTNNESCIDNLDIFVSIKDNVIKDIHFTGEACAISTASTSIMINNLIGKTINEANIFINNFENMIEEKEYDENILKDANCFSEIYKQNNRKTCAILPYKGILKVIKNYEK